MAGKERKAALAVVAVAAVALLAAFELGYLPVRGGASSTTCASCGFEEPVVDVIMPAIGSSGNASNPNRTVNMTLGSSQAFEVDVYPTIPLNFTMSFSAVLMSASGGSSEVPSASFVPGSVDVAANGKGVTTMTIVVPSSAAAGSYDAVVSALNIDNNSQVWGLYFQLQVA